MKKYNYRKKKELIITSCLILLAICALIFSMAIPGGIRIFKEEKKRGLLHAHLGVKNLQVPAYASLGEFVKIFVHVIGSVEVEELEVRFGDETLYLPAGQGGTSEVFSAELYCGTPGVIDLEIVPKGKGGIEGEAKSVQINVTDDAVKLDKKDIPDFQILLDDWNKRGVTPLEPYERDPFLYSPSKLSKKELKALNKESANKDTKMGNVYDYNLSSNWWRNWRKQGGGQPFKCKDKIGPDGKVLRYWLELNPKVAKHIVWVLVDPNTGKTTDITYDQWSAPRKEDLDIAFYDAWKWLDSGLKTKLNSWPDPAVNQLEFLDGQWKTFTGLSGAQAWNLYKVTISHSLALEIGGFVPWSIVNYSNGELKTIFDSREMLEGGKFKVAHKGDTSGKKGVIGYFPSDVLHAPPVKTFSFFVGNDIIRYNHYHTISHLLGWSMGHMLHNMTVPGEDPTEEQYNTYQYNGDAPVSRILDGTIRKYLEELGVISWSSGGCHGTTLFFKSILRSLNIPVLYLAGYGDSGHGTPVFTTIGHALSHGDDVYKGNFNLRTMDPPYLPPQKMLISMEKFDEWFNIPTGYKNVGRQNYEVALDILPNKVLDLYCADISSMKHPSEGLVCAMFADWYSYEDLVDMDLWGRLEKKEKKLNYYKNYYYQGKEYGWKGVEKKDPYDDYYKLKD